MNIEPIGTQTSYHRTAMNLGESRYAEAVFALGDIGPVTFTQTGGMCAALQVTLERGYLLVTDTDDSLPWNPDELRGWGVGYYPSDDVCEGPDHFVSGTDTSTAALSTLAVECLRGLADSSRPQAAGGASGSGSAVPRATS